MVITVMEEHFIESIVGLPQFKRSQGKFPLGTCGVFDLLCISDNVTASTNQLFQRVVNRTRTIHDASIRVTMANLVVEPEVKIFVSTRAGLRIEHQKIFCSEAEFFRCHCKGTRTGTRFGNKRLIQRAALLWSLSASFRPRKNVM